MPRKLDKGGIFAQEIHLPSKGDLEEGLGAEQEGRCGWGGDSSGGLMGLACCSALRSGSCVLFSGSHEENNRRLSTSSLPGRAQCFPVQGGSHRVLMVPCEPSLLSPSQR